VNLGAVYKLGSRTALLVLVALLVMPLDVRAQKSHNYTASQTVTVAGVWSGSEQAGFQAVLDEFTTQTGFATAYEQVTTGLPLRLSNCVQDVNCPDIAFIGPGLLRELVMKGALVPLELVFTDFDSHFSQTWRTASSVNGVLYAIPFKTQSKSMIWYRPQTFTSAGVSVPGTWAELLALADDFVADGLTPFSIGVESGGADGWPLSDWFENILLRVGGPDAHRKLVSHDSSWTSPLIVETMQRFEDIVGREDYQVGGAAGTLGTNFLDAIDPVFGSPATSAMYFEGGFVRVIIADRHPSLNPTTDYNFFDFPEIHPAYGKPIVGGLDLAVLFHDTPAAQALMQFLATPEAAEIWATQGGYISPNNDVSLAAYPDQMVRDQAQQMMEASDFVFDLDDQLPVDLQVYLWKALMDFVTDPDQLTPILQGIEAKATELQGLPYSVFLPFTRK
jgi:ABC-type glycerol-3-phosphate transport system substrate-binding protein